MLVKGSQQQIFRPSKSCEENRMSDVVTGVQVSKEPEGHIWAPRAGVTSRCELHNVGAGNQKQVFGMSSKHWQLSYRSRLSPLSVRQAASNLLVSKSWSSYFHLSNAGMTGTHRLVQSLGFIRNGDPLKRNNFSLPLDNVCSFLEIRWSVRHSELISDFTELCTKLSIFYSHPKKIYYFVCVRMCHISKCWWRPEDIRFPGADVTGSCETSSVDARKSRKCS